MDRFSKDLTSLAPAGYYLALRVGFAFPLEQINRLPADWVETYARNRYVLFDPIIRWCYQNTGVIRWSEVGEDDPLGIMAQTAASGLRFGAAVAVIDEVDCGQRSFGFFARGDREYRDAELAQLLDRVTRLHDALRAPTTLTPAELEALRMVRDGMRIKQIAHVLGISEGAVKQRLRNAKSKLGAATSTQAAALASGFGLL